MYNDKCTLKHQQLTEEKKSEYTSMLYSNEETQIDITPTKNWEIWDYRLVNVSVDGTQNSHIAIISQS